MENGNNNPNGQRLFLNFNDNNRFASPSDARNFPTTPSTFPQPVFQGGQGQGAPQQQQQQQYQNSFPQAPAGYFAGNGQYGNSSGGANLQPMQQQQQQQQYPQQSYQRGADAASGLAHQLSHQNLGGTSRQDQYRQGSSPHRPRTAGSSGGGYQQQGYQNYSSQQAPPMPTLEFVPTPTRNPDKYGDSTHNNQKRCAQLATDFFKDSVKRARERNMRYGLLVSKHRQLLLT